MNRPELNKKISVSDFNDFYWLKKELIDFCRNEGIRTSGGKAELADRVLCFLQTGEVPKVISPKAKTKSAFNWGSEDLTRLTHITDNYVSGQNVRSFFTKEIGPHFSFNVIFMKWMKDNVAKTLGDALVEWNRINEMKKEKDYVSEIGPQFEYNRYMRSFLKDNPELSSSDAMKFWKLKRAKRGTNEYQPEDLDLK